MIFVLDFDGTYAATPNVWNQFISNAASEGHTVVCATMRHEDLEGDEVKDAFANRAVRKIIFTDRKAKYKIVQDALLADGYNPIDIHRAVWIDDNPQWLFQDA